MYNYLIDDQAVTDLIEAEFSYRIYFAHLGEYSKGEQWARRFMDEYRRHIELLKENPFIHGICTLYPFDCVETKYRRFTVGWHTAFYTVDDASFTVWAVRSSKSDFSSLGSPEGH